MELLKQIWKQTGFGFSDIHLQALLVVEMDWWSKSEDL